MSILSITGYKFIDILNSELPQLKEVLYQEASRCQLKGTILLSEEGVNVFLAGYPQEILSFKLYLKKFSYFESLTYRENYCEQSPFDRLCIKIKPEIITMGQKQIKPAQKTAAYIEPKRLKQWYEQNKDMILLDTRNKYEYAFGSFEKSVHLNIEHFKHFAEAVSQLPEEMKKKPVVTFCTGGIRCEKAAAYMQEQGFKEVYQLQGGILNYFAQCGGEHYQGECFVFDNRVAVNSELKETETTHCHSCQAPVSNQFDQCMQCAGPVRKKNGLKDFDHLDFA